METLQDVMQSKNNTVTFLLFGEQWGVNTHPSVSFQFWDTNTLKLLHAMNKPINIVFRETAKAKYLSILGHLYVRGKVEKGKGMSRVRIN